MNKTDNFSLNWKRTCFYYTHALIYFARDFSKKEAVEPQVIRHPV